MRKTVRSICAAGLVTAGLFVILPLNAAEQTDRDQEMVTVVYPVADLPLWSIGGDEPRFDPALLIVHIKSAVDPNSWEDRGSVARHEKTQSLVVRQTRANHRKIADILTSLRGPGDPREQVEVKAAPSKATEQAAQNRQVNAGQMKPVVYPVADLPVWVTANGERMFDPSDLIAYIKNGIGLDKWTDATIGPHERTLALVVRQSDANHRKIADLLTKLRPQRFHDEVLINLDDGLGVSPNPSK